MIRVYLTLPEYRHFLDLFHGAGAFRLSNNASPAEVREQKIMALDSVIGMDRPRERIGDDEVEVYGSRSVETIARWQ